MKRRTLKKYINSTSEELILEACVISSLVPNVNTEKEYEDYIKEELRNKELFILDIKENIPKRNIGIINAITMLAVNVIYMIAVAVNGMSFIAFAGFEVPIDANLMVLLYLFSLITIYIPK